MYEYNSIVIYIYNEITNTLITDTVTIDYDSTTLDEQATTSTSNGSKIIDNIAPGNYEISFYGGLYPKRRYYVTLLNNSFVRLNAKLLNDTEGAIITFTVMDKMRKIIKNVSFDAYYRYNATYLIADQDINPKCLKATRLFRHIL